MERLVQPFTTFLILAQNTSCTHPRNVINYLHAQKRACRPGGTGTKRKDTAMTTEKKNIAIGKISEVGPDYGYTGPVYRPANYEIGEGWGEDYTGENRAAHGNVRYTEEESLHGRQRDVLVNGNHIEVGPWSPTRAQREAHEKREAAKALAAVEAEEDAAAKALGVSVVSVSGDTVVCMSGGQHKTVRLSDIREAARDPWHPRLTSDMALKQETAQERQTRLAYRSLLRHATR